MKAGKFMYTDEKQIDAFQDAELFILFFISLNDWSDLWPAWC